MLIFLLLRSSFAAACDFWLDFDRYADAGPHHVHKRFPNSFLYALESLTPCNISSLLWYSCHSRTQKKEETLPRIIRESIWDKIKRKSCLERLGDRRCIMFFRFLCVVATWGLNLSFLSAPRGFGMCIKSFRRKEHSITLKTVFGLLFTRCLVLGNFLSFNWDFLEKEIISSLSGKTSEMKLLLNYWNAFKTLKFYSNFSP